MVTVKKLLHEIFTEDTIKVLAIGFVADNPRSKLNRPEDMTISEYNRLTASDRIFVHLNDTEENKEKFRKAICENRLKEVVISGKGLTDTERNAACEILFSPRW
jgi:hypothetical protein|nr:MAG TPA: hypothetical protein [Caudoviricetes sp.]DAO46909.1 MAG TPA: hypothetical protein [Caudoviricetes sp.]DAX12941.1 MAG TPA: hypothetical protein [Bacteriophage sp.]